MRVLHLNYVPTFSRIHPKLNEGVAVPRDFSDYTVSVDEEGMPSGVTLERKHNLKEYLYG